MSQARVRWVLVVGAAVIAALLVFGTQNSTRVHASSKALHTMPVAEGDEGEGLGQIESYWDSRLTYPTGDFDPAWVREAAQDAAQIPKALPAVGPDGSDNPAAQVSTTSSTTSGSSATLAAAGDLNSSGFTALGPAPEHMTGCSSCFDYGTTSGRINNIVIDPTTTTAGSIVAYAASVGGGVWKTTNCCNSGTTWSVMTDSPLVNTTSIDSVTLDPNNHNTVYAGTGDLNYGSFSMGSQGVLKSTDGGQTWSVLGAEKFGLAYSEPAGNFPQYDAVGKVRVDPNDSNKVVAGTKKGLFISYDAGANWTGPCVTNSFSAQRQDITALELSNMGGSTRILAAVGVRGYATPVQYDLGQNGANGIYRATMPSSGCPTFTSIARNDNGFVFGNQVTGSAYPTGALMNAGSGDPYVSSTTGDQLGRIDLGVAPSNPNVIYAQVQSITPNNNSGGSAGCGNANGCQLGAWASTDGGDTWSYMQGSQGGALKACASTGPGSSTTAAGDYPQNWYDQGIAVDPNNPDRVFFDTFEVWLASRTGTTWYDTTCGYNGSSIANHVVHVDQHALAFVPGSSSVLLAGNDGGVHVTSNANVATLNTARPTWSNMDTGFNTIEFYSGDISGNFATSSNPSAAGGAQDNAPSVASFPGGVIHPVQWQVTTGGDGFSGQIDPVGTGFGLRYWTGNNSGGLARCSATATNTCLASGTGYNNARGAWTADQQSFILPINLFHGGIPGGDDCAPAAPSGGGCGHLIAGTTRVWETVTGNASGTPSWYVTNSPSNQNMTKGTLGNRSYINQLKYSPKWSSVAMVGTNDANVWIGFHLGTGVAGQANWVNVTGGNSVLPNRPVLGVALDPSSPDVGTEAGYAAVGGFNANTPGQNGHVFQVQCSSSCSSFSWADKTGNLPDIPVDSVIVNPNFPQQVFAGTDLGLFFTNNINAASPTWYRFTKGLPPVMIWDMQIDRGATTLSVWTRSRGAYVWALPNAPVTQTQTISFSPLADKTYGDPDFDVSATASSGLAVGFGASGNCTVSGNTVHITAAGSCTITASQAGNIDYSPADNVSQSFNVGKADQTISFDTVGDHTFGDPDFDVAATASSTLPVSLAATGPCSLDSATSPAHVHVSGSGTCSITASQAGNDNYNAAPDEVRSFSIGRASQTISFGSLADKTWGDADFDVSATSSSGLDVSFSAAGDCTISGKTVHITGAGSCAVTASQNGNGNYNPAADVTQTFAINKAEQSIDFGPLGDKTYGDPDFAIGATSTSGLDVSFAASGKCTVSGTTVHITGAGTCNVTASQDGNGNYNAAASVTRVLTIKKADQTISYGSFNDPTFGDADFTIGATATSGLPVSLAVVSGPCSLDSGTSPANVHIAGAGLCTIKASQAGDGNYNAAPDVNRSFSINKEGQTISFGALQNKTFGDPNFTVSATASSGLPVTFSAVGSCTITGNVVHIVGVNQCTITASQTGNANFNPAPDVTQAFYVYWPFTGFFSPADQALNVVQAGSTVPLKFSLGGNRGLAILMAGSPASQRIDCTSGGAIGIPAAIDTPGQSGLAFINGLYQENWQTDKAWAGTCRDLQLKLVDGTTHTAHFRFK